MPTPHHPPLAANSERIALRRSLGFWHALLYGLGITIGAGIYVLIGPVAKTAGMAAPAAFILAALLMSLSALSFAELATRMPVAAGEAAYVSEGFGSRAAGTVVGLAVIIISIITAAAISLGSAQYIEIFLELPRPVIVAAVVLTMGAVAAWGILQSVTFAAAMTVIETGGLIMIVLLGAILEPATLARLPEAIPDLTAIHTWHAILSAGLLAVFAFIGFEGIVNVAEEMRVPRRDLPRAILTTLAVTALIYVAVVWVALVTLGPERLGGTDAPLAAVFVALTGWPRSIMAAISIVATLNGIIAAIILASRVAYGLARRGDIPHLFARVSPLTRTPLAGTAVVTGLVLVLAFTVPLTGLAEWSSRLTLAMFATVNAALVAIKLRETEVPQGVFVTPIWVPAAGVVTTVAFVASDLLAR